jgi:hypothetical protein
MALYTADGARRYVTAGEREIFLRAAERADREVRTLCMTLAYGGCRLSEALALTADRVDLAGKNNAHKQCAIRGASWCPQIPHCPPRQGHMRSTPCGETAWFGQGLCRDEKRRCQLLVDDQRRPSVPPRSTFEKTR